MSKLVFVNLPVGDLARSVAMYQSIGASRNPMFSDDTAACMVFSDTIHAMLLTHAKWRSFTDREIPDAHKSAQVLICISADSRQDVDRIVDTAGQNGGTSDPNPVVDYPFMYSRSLADPDGHIWEIMWMDPASAPPTPDAAHG